MNESYRLHKIHCDGCSEYKNHGGDRVESKTGLVPVAGHGEFDSPPPPPTHRPWSEIRRPRCICGCTDHVCDHDGFYVCPKCECHD